MAGVEEKLRSALARVRGFRGIVAVEDGKTWIVGEVDREKLPLILDTFSFSTELLRKARNIGVRILIAEGSGSGIAYAKYGFGKQVFVLYRDMPLGTVYYEVKRLMEDLAKG